MTKTLPGIAWATVVGWIAFGFSQIIDDPFARFFLLAVARVLP